MKKIKSWWTIGILALSLSGFAQYNPVQEANSLQISYAKTTSIVFPYAVKSVDRGSQDVLVQKAKGVENILLVKAGKRDFTQTNLTVVTTDGKIYGFILNFDELCPTLNLVAGRASTDHKDALFASENENQKKIAQYALSALTKKKKVGGLKVKQFDMELKVNGLFIHQDVMYLRVVLGNSSRINYDVEQLRFFIRDQKKTSRTASQEIEIQPLFITSNLAKIPDESEIAAVFAFPKFTIPEKKYFALQLMEKEGGRHLELDVKNSNLRKVEVLTTL